MSIKIEYDETNNFLTCYAEALYRFFVGRHRDIKMNENKIRN